MSFLTDRHTSAVHQVDHWVRQNVYGAKALDNAVAGKLWHAATSAWHWPLQGHSTGHLALLVDADFPFSLPRFFLQNCADLSLDPHIEKSGRLCLAGDDGRVDASSPIEVVAHQYHEAVGLLQSNASGQNREDYHLDFEAYWRRDKTTEREILTWLSNTKSSRLVSAFHSTAYYLIAETPDDCRRWLENRYGPGDRAITSSAAIWMDELPEPKAYPANANSLRRLITDHSPDGASVFDSLMVKMEERAAVVLMSNSGKYGVVQAVAIVDKPNSIGGGSAPSVSVHKGFRPGRTPATILAMRRTAKRADSDRVDAWLSRTREAEGLELAEKRVAVIGCGSLGAGVARLLIQSGVGRLLLVDPDGLSWANLGRHELGANHVKDKKVTALAQLFRKSFPHTREIRDEPVQWQTLHRRDAESLRQQDLILSLTGDWNSENALNSLQRSGELSTTILYGWLEQQVGAAHAVAIGPEGACLQCGFSPTGTILVPATRWLRTSPGACGAPSNVYGAVELAPAHSLVATACVDLLLNRAATPFRRTWLGSSHLNSVAGGSWHPSWVKNFGDPAFGNQMTATDWPQSSGCPCPHKCLP